MEEAIDFVVLMFIYIFVLFKKWKREGKEKLFLKTTMYIYLSFVLYFTLMPIITSIPFIFNHPYDFMNLKAFIDVTLGRGDFQKQIILNIIMTIPFGVLLPLIKKQNLLKTVFYTFLLSLTIEIIQPLINGCRSSDITDIIINTFGGLVGYLIYVFTSPIIFRIKKKNCLKNKK